MCRALFAAAVEAVAVGAAGRGRDRCDASQVCEGCLGTHPFRVVVGRSQQLAGGFGADAVEPQEHGGGLPGQEAEFSVQLGDLLVHGLVAAGQAAWRRAGRGQRAGQVVAGPQSGQGAFQGRTVHAGGLLTEHRRRGDEQTPDLVHRLGASLDRAAAGDAQHADGSTTPSLLLGVPVARPDRTAVAAA